MHCKLSLETENTGRTWTNIIPLDKSINKCQIILWNSSPSIFWVRRKLQISNLCLICFYSLFNNLKPASPSCKKEQEEKHVQHTWFFIAAEAESRTHHCKFPPQFQPNVQMKFNLHPKYFDLYKMWRSESDPFFFSRNKTTVAHEVYDGSLLN